MSKTIDTPKFGKRRYNFIRKLYAHMGNEEIKAAWLANLNAYTVRGVRIAYFHYFVLDDMMVERGIPQTV